MPYFGRKKLLLCALTATLAFFAAAADEQKIAVVNVSMVFENYKKVPDIQRRIDAIHEKTKQELEARGKDLTERNRGLEQAYQQAGNSEGVFDAVQKLRKEQYTYEHDVEVLNEKIAKDYTREMREVLSDIRSAIRVQAQSKGFEMVLRSPDTDDPPEAPQQAMNNPADKSTFLQKIKPKTVLEVLERFNRNPVLYGSDTTDITAEVLSTLNTDFLKKSLSLPGVK